MDSRWEFSMAWHGISCKKFQDGKNCWEGIFKKCIWNTDNEFRKYSEIGWAQFLQKSRFTIGNGSNEFK